MNTNSEMQPLLLKGAQVAEALGISRALAYRWMSGGILPTVRVSKSIACRTRRCSSGSRPTRRVPRRPEKWPPKRNRPNRCERRGGPNSSTWRWSMSVSHILSRVKISGVCHVLTGREPRRTGRDTWRTAATWRVGDGLSVSGDDSRGVFHDFVTGEGGGILDLIVTVRGGSRQDALRWLAEFTGAPLEDKPLSPEDRTKYVRQRQAIERNLPSAALEAHGNCAYGGYPRPPEG